MTAVQFYPAKCYEYEGGSYIGQGREINAQGQTIVRTADDIVTIDEPGSHKPAWFAFECPVRGGWCSGLIIRGSEADEGKRPAWEWNGSYDMPTFKPSINCLAHNPQNPSEKYVGCGWHGWITDGKAT